MTGSFLSLLVVSMYSVLLFSCILNLCINPSLSEILKPSSTLSEISVSEEMEKKKKITNICVIPDTHGDFLTYKESIVLCKDANKIIILGDIFDRGPHGIFILRDIEKKILEYSNVKKTEVILLFGNHEILNLMHLADSYVSATEISIFGSKDIRRKSWSEGGEIWNFLLSNASLLHIHRFRNETGKDAKGILFVHAGILPQHIEKYSTDTLNKNFIEMVKTSTYLPHLTIDGNSPVWTRKYGIFTSDTCNIVNEIKHSLNISLIIVGHTPQDDQKVRILCDNSLILADIGVSRWMAAYGRPLAINIEIEDFINKEIVKDNKGNEEDNKILPESGNGMYSTMINDDMNYISRITANYGKFYTMADESVGEGENITLFERPIKGYSCSDNQIDEKGEEI